MTAETQLGADIPQAPHIMLESMRKSRQSYFWEERSPLLGLEAA